jgi:hypothetical protein
MPLPSDSVITFRTTDLAKWGLGKGSPLTSVEADENLWQLLEYIAAAAAAAGTPHEIASITVTSNKMTVTLDNGTAFGPFTLPSAAFRWTGAFVGGFDYKTFDILTASDGAYLVLQDHTAATTFDPAATNMSGNLYALMFAYQNLYDIGFFYPGLVGLGTPAGQPMFAYRFVRDAYLLADLPGTLAGFKSSPTDGPWTIEFFKNAASIGSYTYDPSLTDPASFSFAANVQFNAGDVLYIYPPTTSAIDSSAEGFSLTFLAKKGTF